MRVHACSARIVLCVNSAGSVPPSCGSGSGALGLLDSRLFLRSSFARSVLARAASPRDAALPALPAVLMAVAMPPTVLVLVVQKPPVSVAGHGVLPCRGYAARLCPLYLAPTPVCSFVRPRVGSVSARAVPLAPAVRFPPPARLALP